MSSLPYGKLRWTIVYQMRRGLSHLRILMSLMERYVDTSRKDSRSGFSELDLSSLRYKGYVDTWMCCIHVYVFMYAV